MKVYEDLKEMLEDEIKKITKKNDITPAELESVKKVVEIIAMIDYVPHEDNKQGEYSNRGYSYRMPYYPYYHDGGRSYDEQGMSRGHGGGVYMGSYEAPHNNMSYDDMHMSHDGRRGRDADSDGRYSERRGRDAMGRYTSRDMEGHSRHTEKEHMVRQLEDMLDDAKTDRERKTIEKCIDKIDR